MSAAPGPLVSVVVPAYNHERFVTRAIESVLGQSYPHVELIVIDDGSRDSTAAVVQRLAEQHHFTFITRPNRGVSATLNQGLELSRGTYWAVLASDDFYEPHKLAHQVEVLEARPEYAMTCGPARLVDDAGADLHLQTGRLAEAPFDITFERLLGGNCIAAPTAFVRTEVLKAIGGFDPKVRVEDWDAWLRLSHQHRIRYEPVVVASYRQHPHNVSRNARLETDVLTILGRWRHLAEGERAFVMHLEQSLRNIARFHKRAFPSVLMEVAHELSPARAVQLSALWLLSPPQLGVRSKVKQLLRRVVASRA